MAYNKNLPAGTYRARALQADCFPTNNGEGLMLGIEWAITQGEYEGSQLSGNICLIDSSGNLTKNYAQVREWAKSWDGIDTAYFKGHFDEWDVEIVTERKVVEINGEEREVPEVKYVNDPNGSHGKAVKAGDHKTLGAKFGAKLRAAAAQTAKPTAPAARPQAAKPSVPAPATPPASPLSTIPVEQLMREAWDAFKAHHADLGADDLKNTWFDIIRRHYPEGEDIRKAPASVWEKVLADVNDDMPF